jgi:hypothetical protein
MKILSVLAGFILACVLSGCEEEHEHHHHHAYSEVLIAVLSTPVAATAEVDKTSLPILGITIKTGIVLEIRRVGRAKIKDSGLELTGSFFRNENQIHPHTRATLPTGIRSRLLPDIC